MTRSINIRIYIIGSGVAGLIYSFLDKNCLVIDPNPLGQLNSKYVLGPRLLQYNKGTEKFFEQYRGALSLNKELKIKALIGYKSNNILYNSANDEFKKRYSLLTRGKDEYEESFLSGSKNIIEHYIFENIENSYLYLFEKFLELLEKQNRIIKEKVISIDLNNKKIVTNNNNYQYDNLISTLNIKLFKKLCNRLEEKDEKLFSTMNKHFYVTKNIYQFCDFDYIYSIDRDYTRKTIYKDYIVYETSEKYEDIKFENKEIIYKVENLPIQIQNSLNIEKFEEVFLLGRYAQWDHKLQFCSIIPKCSRITKEIYG